MCVYVFYGTEEALPLAKTRRHCCEAQGSMFKAAFVPDRCDSSDFQIEFGSTSAQGYMPSCPYPASPDPSLTF